MPTEYSRINEILDEIEEGCNDFSIQELLDVIDFLLDVIDFLPDQIEDL